jgi:hypothetical protein
MNIQTSARNQNIIVLENNAKLGYSSDTNTGYVDGKQVKGRGK